MLVVNLDGEVVLGIEFGQIDDEGLMFIGDVNDYLDVVLESELLSLGTDDSLKGELLNVICLNHHSVLAAFFNAIELVLLGDDPLDLQVITDHSPELKVLLGGEGVVRLVEEKVHLLVDFEISDK